MRRKSAVKTINVSREMFVEDKRLEKYGENCANIAYKSSKGYTGIKSVIKTLNRNIKRYKKLIETVNRFTASDLGNIKSYLPSEFSWLNENEYMIEKEGKVIKRELNGKYKLPMSDTKMRYPSVYLLASDLLKTGAGALSPERLILFLRGVQKEQVMREDEFNLFINMLKCAAIAAILNLGNDVLKIIEGYKLAENESGVNPFYSEMEIWRSYEHGISPDKKTILYSQTAERLHEHLSESLKNYFMVLRKAGDNDYIKALRASSKVEKALLDDPAGIYRQMDDDSKAYYRHLISVSAKRRNTTEYELSKKYLEESRAHSGPVKNHIGYYILNDTSITSKKTAGGKAYITLDILVPLLISITLGIFFKNLLLTLAVLLPLWEISRSLLLYIFLKATDRSYVPALALEDGVPDKGRTLCVITILVDSEKFTLEHIDYLEKYYLSNKKAGDNVHFGILADFPDSVSQTAPSDAVILEKAHGAIDFLNKKYGNHFCFIHRERSFNKRENSWIGRERKRGAIESLCELIREGSSESICYGLDAERLSGVSYLITLDGDTKIMPGSIRKMVGSMLHPLNRAVVDSDKKCVVSGYGIMQPRVSVELKSANATLFSRIFAGQGGTDPYSSSSGDIYQNLFSESIFIGKGIIDVIAMHSCLKDMIPDNSVLSHDLLEGSFLRTACLSGTELPDGFPSSVKAYYKRMGRWIRGDVQLIPWLFPRIKTKYSVINNPLSRLSKFKIADNLRRAITSILCFLLIALYAIFTTPQTAAAAICSLAALSAPLILNGIERINNFGNKVNTRYHSTIYAGFRGGLMLFVSRFLFLPFEAWIQLKSVSKSLWRMLVTKRKLLEWMTAAEAEKYKTKGILGEYVIMLPLCVSALIIVIAGMNIISAVLAIFWVLTPLYSKYISKKVPHEPEYLITEKDREYLLNKARDVWNYFNDFLSVNHNFLPPDNYQEEPCGTIAHRTSPTNIGLSLLSILTAKKLEFIDEEKAVELIGNILNIVKRLEKYKGHLYNWYDTQTLGILNPETISTVDSGNFTACVLITARALEEFKCEKAKELASVCRELFENADFGIMYDSDNQLLRIGLNADKENLGGYYDMLASEARLTSYIGIAKGDVPCKHWKRLSRHLSELNGYSGLVSWSGSCFEYLMPNIIMPEQPNSLIFESNRYAIYCQRMRTRRNKKPWGISESCYFAFDSALNYQYKAHGVASLALKAGVNEELVVSPYSTYLALISEPQKAIKNLKELDMLDVNGRYGLYEAIDFTHQRLPAGEKYKTVKAYMTHHMGMSLCAIGNTLNYSENGGYLCDLFVKEPILSSCESLLCERVPINAVNITTMKPTPSIKKPANLINGYSYIIEKYNFWLPACNISTNKRYSVLSSASGITRSMMSDILIYHSDRSAAARLPGILTLVKTSKTIFSICDLPRDGAKAVKKTIFTSQGTKYTAEYKTLSVTETIRVAPGEAGELREVYVQNKGEIRERITLCFYFEPVLSEEAGYLSHPDFAKMFLSSEKTSDGILITRKSLNSDRDIYLSVLCDTNARFTTSRKRILGRNNVSDISVFFENPELADFGYVRDVGVRILADITIEPKADKIIKLVLSAGTNAENTENSARRILLVPEKNNADVFLKKARSLSLDANAVKEALELVPCIVFEPYARRFFSERIKNVKDGRSGIWKLGISGDVPIAVLSYDDFFTQDEFIKAVFKYIKLHALLAYSGSGFDLVILCADGGDYDRPGFNACFSAIKIANSSRFIGKKGGIHLFDLTQLKEDEVDTLYAAAWFILPLENSTNDSIPLLPAPSPAFNKNPCLKTRVHSSPCANSYFGFFGADYGLTHMWCANSRLFKITPWENDVFTSESSGEEICIIRDNRPISVFCRNDGFRSSVKFDPACITWLKQFDNMVVRTTAYVHPWLPARIVKIEIDGTSDDAVVLTWMLRPILGERNSENFYLTTSYDDKLRTLTVNNPFADDFNPKYLSLATNPVHEGFTCDVVAYKNNSFDSLHGGGFLPCAAFKVALKPVNGRASAVFSAVVSDNEFSKELCAGLADIDKAEEVFVSISDKTRLLTSDVNINTPDTHLNSYINQWNTWQIIGSRLYSISSIYQNGGAYGFRDQLQDASSLLLTKPEFLKKQIYRACAHQYEEGDVMHWFHTGMRRDVKKHRGVRTFCSDDLLWLPWSVSEYINATGDFDILNKKIAYLKSDPLSGSEKERYENAELGPLKETVFEHCTRAIEMFEKRGRGAHNLPKILGGDWNDGFNRIGTNGQGESVWLAWFASESANKFSEICNKIGQLDYSRHLKMLARDLAVAAGNAWDGEWFCRGYDDYNRPVGSKANDECRIDSIAQSFSWFCEAYGINSEESKKKMTALDSAIKFLADFDNKIIRLFTPPFINTREYGYISAYPPGVRENGGQYTHAALWLAMALFKAGKTELGYEILKILLPENHDAEVYEGEQFVIAADVYGYGELTGKCGWSWYTGAAGWYRRAVIESLLGITRKYDKLYISPNVPKHWPGFECDISYGSSKYIIKAYNTGEKTDAQTVFIDDGKIHEIDVFY